MLAVTSVFERVRLTLEIPSNEKQVGPSRLWTQVCQNKKSRTG